MPQDAHAHIPYPVWITIWSFALASNVKWGRNASPCWPMRVRRPRRRVPRWRCSRA